jgi:hypothetical protein
MGVFMYAVDETGINTACLRRFTAQLKDKSRKYTEADNSDGAV